MFDIWANGTACGDIYDNFPFEGWYGQINSSVGVAFYDMDTYSQSEAIMIYENEAPDMDRGFITVGQNVNKAGTVTSAWTDFIELVQMNYE